ncbi:DUF2807 domain-containing protein [Aquimarina sp. ERC-38]|uniref:head GIN domain-containing protein n=1 Tax=Aquimarina sp. ERC-38 TaxID=2949996 RepID=UPI002247787E|nr:head GIN domain-containing protein [Aquimarina sp. ERC-38]UZO80987.1 DUF2807 domain-containing protein [Aquimarina sp. ERC-38]
MRLLIVLFVVMVISCDTENTIDCLQRTGSKVSKELVVSDFKKILVNPNIEVVIKPGVEPSVLIETGDNLLNEISAVVEGDQLILTNNNDCNLVRAFNQTKITVTAVNISEIRSATQFDIISEGVLRFANLDLLSEDFFENTEGNITGQFILNIENNQTTITGNNIGSFFIKGTTNTLKINIASGSGRVDASDFVAEDVVIFHRGSNKLFINPQKLVTGAILSTGDVIALNRPEVIKVSTPFKGRLIFR